MRTLRFPKAVVKYVNMLLLLLLLFVEPGLGRDPINIYWNSTNPIFSSSNPTLIDVNKNTGPWEYDQINIICPSGPRTTEKHVIYSVNKDEFDRCEVGSSASALIVAVCDQPQNFLYFTITFRYFSPSPRQLEFKPGETYFFISTSDPENLLRRNGGYCDTHNMKIKFR
ncbi:ephrin-B1 [Eurytemora carolleeae]|uniref:ephrin-B1 n=1 Tax=Eurytemora carolleeae TaxID=1294199 RepID=UPI000C75A241|nr:ephrin-B1 [Eurytemora carolleeae]|eukprot:XP_023343458.1 ephrin-B1-like [Eurytemora affinis]